MLTLRSSSASRVCAAGSRTAMSLVDSRGAVTSRMMTSTSATSMMGVTLILVISSFEWVTRRMSAPDHGDLAGAERARLVDHRHEVPVRNAGLAAHHHGAGGARLEQRRERLPQRIARHHRLVDAHRAAGQHLELD